MSKTNRKQRLLHPQKRHNSKKQARICFKSNTLTYGKEKGIKIGGDKQKRHKRQLNL